MNLAVQWFCYEALRRGLLEGETCRMLGNLLGGDPELLDYAQAVVDHQLCTDFAAIEELANIALERSGSGDAPPVNVFAVGDSPAPEPEPEPEPEEPAPVARRAPVEATVADFPDLAAYPEPDEATAAALMAQLLGTARAAGASDLHLTAGARPFIRRHLRLHYFGDQPLTAAAASALNLALLNDAQRDRFAAKRDLDGALALPDGGRYRLNLRLHKQGVGGTWRLIPDQVLNLTELGFPDAKTLHKLLTHHNGLILVTGPLGSGKTTTLAALIAYLNEKRHDHIITIEDPLEILQDAVGCNITQREVGGHTDSFHAALKAALREDPDIIVIGELRDLETIEMAITAAETGHLVIATLPTRDAATTLGRLLDVFPPAQQQQIRSMTAESLRGIICQRLLPATDGTVALAAEILVNTIAIANLIRDNKMHQLRGVLQTGSAQGMVTMDDAVLRLFEAGRISAETALANVIDPTTAAKLRNPPPAAPAAAADADPKAKRKWFR